MHSQELRVLQITLIACVVYQALDLWAVRMAVSLYLASVNYRQLAGAFKALVNDIFGIDRFGKGRNDESNNPRH